MEFDTEFMQITSLEPFIYRLTENLNLLKFELWLLSVRTVFNAEASRHCGVSGRLQRPVRTVAQESTVLTWKLHGIFMDIF